MKNNATNSKINIHEADEIIRLMQMPGGSSGSDVTLKKKIRNIKDGLSVLKDIIVLEKMPGGSSDKTLKREIKNIAGGLLIIKNLL